MIINNLISFLFLDIPIKEKSRNNPKIYYVKNNIIMKI